MPETPQKIEVVDATDIERTVAADLTDVLKKNAGVDVVQYSGALSGIGIRGFRPQFSGINKRSLLLIDGRPSGVTNLATLLLDSVERIEVLKGAASSVYGSSAMGGVVNVITRQSRGKIAGTARVGGGSFGATDFGGRIGGSVALARRLRRHRKRVRSTRRLPHGQWRGASGHELRDVRRHRAGGRRSAERLADRRPRERISRARHHDARRPLLGHQRSGQQRSRAVDARTRG